MRLIGILFLAVLTPSLTLVADELLRNDTVADELVLAEQAAVKQAAVPQAVFGQALVPQGNAVANWDTKQMIGPPDTPIAGDITTAWASQSQDGSKVWIELEYAKEITPTAIHIYETYNPGAVYQVSAFEDGKEQLLWKGKDPTSTQAQMGISEIKLDTKMKFKKIRIYLDSPSVPGWNEIDAVAMLDGDQKAHWATDASASSNYSGRTPEIVFVDPFQTPEDRVQEQRTRLLSKIEVRKNEVRNLNDTIDAHNVAIKKLYQQLDAIE